MEAMNSIEDGFMEAVGVGGLLWNIFGISIRQVEVDRTAWKLVEALGAWVDWRWWRLLTPPTSTELLYTSSEWTQFPYVEVCLLPC